jgi:hypothetical protein
MITETKTILVPQEVAYAPSLDQLSMQVGQASKPAAFALVVGERNEAGDIVSGTERLYRFEGEEADAQIQLMRDALVVHGPGTKAAALGIPVQCVTMNDAANFLYARKKAQMAAEAAQLQATE